MKQVITYIIIFTLLSASCRTQEKPNLPDFNLLLWDSITILNTKAIPAGQPIVFIFFSPDCEHCQAETASILEKMDSLKHVRFYFTTIDGFDRMKVFRKYYHLQNYPNIILGRDYSFFMPKTFELRSPPATIIFNKYKQLQIIIEGEVKATDLLTQLNKL